MSPLYAIGDIHGNAWILQQAYARIDEDARILGLTRPQVVLLGDYVDRGPQTRQVIDLILASRDRYDQIELLGNHDDWLSAFLETGFTSKPNDEATLWAENNPSVTFQSYGLNVIKPQLLANPNSVRKALLAAMPRAHREFLKTRPLFHRAGPYLFVHAGIDPNRSWEEQQTDKWPLTWNRDLVGGEESIMGDANPRATHGFSIIHGHFRRLLPEARPGRLNLDTTAYRTNHLAIARVDPEAEEYAILPVVGPQFFQILTQLLHYSAQGGALGEVHRELLDHSRWQPGAPFIFHPYVEALITHGRESPDPAIRAAAQETHSVYRLPAL